MVPSWSWASHDTAVTYTGPVDANVWLTSEVDWHCVDSMHQIRRTQSLSTFGQHCPLRTDFYQDVTSQQLRDVDLFCDSDTPGSALFGWCQVATSFFVKDRHLYDNEKNTVDPSFAEVMYSNHAPPKGSYQPVELLCLSRSHHLDFWMPSRGEDDTWETEPHTITVLVIERQGSVAKRVAIAYITDTELWKRTEKRRMLLKLI